MSSGRVVAVDDRQDSLSRSSVQLSGLAAAYDSSSIWHTMKKISFFITPLLCSYFGIITMFVAEFV